MGYRIEQQKPWGAVALIVASGTGQTSASAADSVASHAAAANSFDGANDSRRPAGIALAP